jgi:hypothetical protein
MIGQIKESNLLNSYQFILVAIYCFKLQSFYPKKIGTKMISTAIRAKNRIGADSHS